MMQRPKIKILKKFIVDKAGHFRFYSPHYSGKNHKPIAPIFNLHPVVNYNKNGIPYPYLNIKTEKQLVTFLKDQYGDGIYMMTAYLKGNHGLYKFWHGEINDEGWIMFRKESQTNELKKLEIELSRSETEEEKAMILQEIGDEKELIKDEMKFKRYGFKPFLLSSGTRGIFHSWSEPDEGLIKKERRMTFKFKDSKNPTLDEMNNF